MARFLLCIGLVNEQSAPSPVRLLKDLHGKDAKVFTSAHHARYFEDDVTYHVVSRVIAGLALMVPSDAVNRVVAGVLGHVQQVYPQIELFAHAFMSNHFHLELRGPGIPEFVGLLKQQLSLRLKHVIDVDFETLWSGRYAATALPCEEDQLRAFEYILSQGVKEGLVEKPEEWPGVHCARDVFFDEVTRGEWLDATRYGIAVRLETRKSPERRREIAKEAYTQEVRIQLQRLPALERLSDAAYVERLRSMRKRIISRGRTARGGRAPVGVEGVLALPRTKKFDSPSPPWFEKRKRMVVWSNLKRPETQAYLARYREAQRRFALASRRYRAGEMDVVFPPGMYRPSFVSRSRALRAA